LPQEPQITAHVGIGANPRGVGFAIDVELHISVAGMDKAQLQALVEKAHQVCPYSNATRGNIRVELIIE
jgi:Ohr subfamily peroxiredoxin